MKSYRTLEFFTGEWKESDSVFATVSVYSLSVCHCVHSGRMCAHFSWVDSFVWAGNEISSSSPMLFLVTSFSDIHLSFPACSTHKSSWFSWSFPSKTHSASKNTEVCLRIYWIHQTINLNTSNRVVEFVHLLLKFEQVYMPYLIPFIRLSHYDKLQCVTVKHSSPTHLGLIFSIQLVGNFCISLF